MRNFSCRCGARVFFENTQCLSCRRELGFLPGESKLLAFKGSELPRLYRRCTNARVLMCNWLVRRDAASGLCQACALNSEPSFDSAETEEQREQRREVERAKRRLLYSLNALGLPIISKREDPKLGLAFVLKRATSGQPVLTGHDDGSITLNLAEADPSEREKVRQSMKERYRTLLGHFRHEVGHYYWYLLVQDRPPLKPFRAVFGDERADYAQALEAHYAAAKGAAVDARFISSYASSHPWEDFAETFAHYLHMVDTLETASEQGFVKVVPIGAAAQHRFDRLLGEWLELSVSLNSLNRSMGIQDAYPFAIQQAVVAKLRFVHGLVHDCRRAESPPWYAPWKRNALRKSA
jgi:hypothetical protein